eukprot:scaffold115113_cov17-Prasinocladus_malaysianus.AAC.1
MVELVVLAASLIHTHALIEHANATTSPSDVISRECYIGVQLSIRHNKCTHTNILIHNLLKRLLTSVIDAQLGCMFTNVRHAAM